MVGPIVLAILAGAAALFALGLGTGLLVNGDVTGSANWVMAAGGLGLIVFSCIQLFRDARHENERLIAARAKLKPAARLARRECEQALFEADGKILSIWLARWYTPVRVRLAGGGLSPIDRLEERLRETVTLATESGAPAIRAADAALDAFILAADIINDLSQMLYDPTKDAKAYDAAIPRAEIALHHLRDAAAALVALAPRGADERPVLSEPRLALVSPGG